MKQIRTYMTVAVLLSIFAPATLLAHHHAVNFLEETIAFFGEVTRVDWTNPHVYIYLETEGDDGTPVEWEIETGSTPSLTRRGWQPDTLKPGDSVTVRGRPDQGHGGASPRSPRERDSVWSESRSAVLSRYSAALSLADVERFLAARSRRLIAS